VLHKELGLLLEVAPEKKLVLVLQLKQTNMGSMEGMGSLDIDMWMEVVDTHKDNMEIDIDMDMGTGMGMEMQMEQKLLLLKKMMMMVALKQKMLLLKKKMMMMVALKQKMLLKKKMMMVALKQKILLLQMRQKIVSPLLLHVNRPMKKIALMLLAVALKHPSSSLLVSFYYILSLQMIHCI
jgi:hypothetical protein